MSKIIMMRGLPASGKSTKAKEIVAQGNWVRLNRDLLREMMHFNKWTGKNEAITVKAEKTLARYYLSTGTSVVIDDTNLGDKHRQLWSGIAQEYSAKFEVVTCDTPIDECIKRDSVREKRVGDHVIKGMALQYGLYQPKKGFVLCDIDGTVADCEHRRHYVSDKESKDWQSFFDNMMGDLPRLNVVAQVTGKILAGYELIFVTARPDNYRAMTVEWLRENVGLDHFTVIMRHSGDTRPDTDVKEQMYKTYFEKYLVDCVFDDRPSVINMWRNNGLEVIDVGNGVDF